MTQEQLLEGIDVSHYQGVIDWEGVRAAGKRFAYCKASEGATLADPSFERNMAGARAADLRAGAYHFLAAGSSGEAQARHFLQASKPCWSDLPPMLDVEIAGKAESPSALWARVRAWCALVWAAPGARQPIIYTMPSLARAYHAAQVAPELAAHPLWVAHWGVSAPLVPKPWQDWLIWQKTNKGRVAGIRGTVDLNVARPALFDGA